MAKARQVQRTVIAFWLWWGVLHFLLFVPNYLLYSQEATFWPSTTLEGGNTLGTLRILFLRNNQDIFRLCGDWAVLSFLLWLGWNGKKWWNIATWWGAVFYLLLFVYNTYWVFYQNVYHAQPRFADDYLLVKEVLPVFLKGIGMGRTGIYIGAIVGFLFLLVILIGAYAKWIRLAARMRITRGAMAMWILMFAFIGAGTWKYRAGHFPSIWQTVQWFGPRIWQSMRPLQVVNAHQGPFFHLLRANMLKPLAYKPNVYLVFVEAYGSVVAVSPYTRDRFRSYVDSLAEQLRCEGILTATRYSRSPVIGGRSWLAFTSAMTGLWLEHHADYDRLLDYKGVYPHLVAFFNAHGYATTRISTMKADKSIDSLIPLDRINRFFRFAHWLRWDDIPYRGYPYNPFGGIPDQYSLEYYFEKVAQADPRPDFLFFITTNSHAPWYLPPPVLTNWHLLDTIRHSPHGSWWALPKGMMQRYYQSIAYQLGMLAQFAQTHLGPDDLLIVVGDHQPPGISHTYELVDAHATPVHVFSRRPALWKYLLDEGFTGGLYRGEDQRAMWRHDSLAWWLETLLLEFEPDGETLTSD